MAIEIRLLQNTELELANNFFNEIYNTNRTFEHFLWEFLNGPAGKAIYVVAVDVHESSFKIVGTQCAIPLELIGPGGDIILTAKSEDTLVHPEYRGQKLFEKMYDLLFEECTKTGIKYIWGFTPALKAFERIGFLAPFSTSQAMMVFKPNSAYRYLVKLNPKNNSVTRFKIFILCLISWLNGFKRLFAAATKLEFKEVPPYNKDSLLQAFNTVNPYLYFIRQHDAYNHWRMKLNPFENIYRNFTISEKNITKADVLVNVRKEVSYIEQLLFSQALSDEHRKQIVKKTIDKLKEANTPLIRVLCFTNNEEALKQVDILKKTGFTYLERGNYFVWKSLDPGNAILTGHIFLTRLFTQGNT